ncbi:dipeptidase [Flavobacteriaceae bacterium]|jgi:acetylornithine deacetylase/succinyl-diaminopimelate desuccinylase-like protein|nr:dipeptidase [Flavobacteriaceae bacterium]MDA9588096.1 dipeptidase [Flavobacteriaceae bacterium]MDC0872034.1 dipeptidase [Flavobacteriaceae bacterium]
MKKMKLNHDQQRFLEEWMDFLKIPSISADPAHTADVQEAAQWVKNALLQAGCPMVEIIPTEGHPIVYGAYLVDPDLPTVLVYGHYDVQPPDPLELWDSPPFEPIVKTTALHPDGAVFARGACDDKGQMFMHIKAFEMMRSQGPLSCNVKFMIEGEEEVGSDNLEDFVKANKEKLKCDIILISDTGMIAKDQPSITTGLRGLSYMEVCVTGPNRDLHSGLYGGAVQNPINVLCEMIAQLKDENKKITIPGFYDKVVELSEKERAEMGKAPFDLEGFKSSIGIKEVLGEKGYNTEEHRSIRPTLDVNGIWGGYTGEGAKTVIPSKAYAKISMRLVPNQDWNEISELFTQYFKSLAPVGVEVEIVTHHGGYAYVTPTDTIGYQAAQEAYLETFGTAPVPKRGGGSIPIVPMFEKELGVKSILMGFGLDSDAIHSPNEHYGLFNFFKGIETIPKFYEHYVRLCKEE